MVRRLVNDQLERISKKTAVLLEIFWHLTAEIEENRKSLSHDTLCSGQNSKRAPLKYKSTALQLKVRFCLPAGVITYLYNPKSNLSNGLPCRATKYKMNRNPFTGFDIGTCGKSAEQHTLYEFTWFTSHHIRFVWQSEVPTEIPVYSVLGLRSYKPECSVDWKPQRRSSVQTTWE
jgi:hypothetical protein